MGALYRFRLCRPGCEPLVVVLRRTIMRVDPDIRTRDQRLDGCKIIDARLRASDPEARPRAKVSLKVCMQRE